MPHTVYVITDALRIPTINGKVFINGLNIKAAIVNPIQNDEHSGHSNGVRIYGILTTIRLIYPIIFE